MYEGRKKTASESSDSGAAQATEESSTENTPVEEGRKDFFVKGWRRKCKWKWWGVLVQLGWASSVLYRTRWTRHLYSTVIKASEGNNL